MPIIQVKPVNTVVARLLREGIRESVAEAQDLLETCLSESTIAPDTLASLDSHLDQLRGAMAILELAGGRLLVESLRVACSQLPAREGRARKHLAADIGEGLIAIPLFFDHLLKTQRDVPSLLLPVINLVRSQSGQGILPDSQFADPAWSKLALPPAGSHAESQSLQGDMGNVRHMFATGLLGILQQRYQRISLKLMHRAADQLYRRLAGSPAGQQWQLASAVLEAAIAMNTENTLACRQLWIRLEKSLRQLSQDSSFANQPQDAKWQRDALFFLALSACPHASATTLLAMAQAPAAPEWTARRLQQERYRMFGKTSETVDSMARELRLEMGQAKRVVEYMVTQAVTDKAISTLAARLKKIADAVRIAGLMESYDLLWEMLQTLKRWHDRQEQPGRQQVLSMADTLLFIESRFSEIDGIGDWQEAPEQSEQLFMVSRRQLLDAQSIVVKESLSNLKHIKTVIGVYIENAFDEARLENLNLFTCQVWGGLVMLDLARPAAIMNAADHFVRQLIAEKVAASDLPRMMEALADVLVTLEHYLEEYEISRKADESLLLIAEKSLETLGYTGVSSVLSHDSLKEIS